jgi:hypothetical protein
LEKKATQRNSHIISAALLKKAIGKRDYELSYKISTAELLTDEFYGKSRLDNPSTTIKQNPHSRDYYFCPECEKRMGHLESGVILALTNCGEAKFEKNYSNFISPGGIAYKTFNEVGSDEFNMFFLLTVWRIALLYGLEKNIHPLRGYRGYEMELMRDILFWYIYGDAQNYERLKDQFAVMIFRAESNSDPTRNFSTTIDFADRPNIFWAFDYLILVYSAKDIEEAPQGDDAYFLLKPDVELINTPPILPRIAFVKEEVWNDLVTSILGFTSKGFFQNMLSELAEATGLPKNFCHIILYLRAKDIEAEIGKLFSDCCLIAFREIVDTVNKDKPTP